MPRVFWSREASHPLPHVRHPLHTHRQAQHTQETDINLVCRLHRSALGTDSAYLRGEASKPEQTPHRLGGLRLVSTLATMGGVVRETLSAV